MEPTIISAIKEIGAKLFNDSLKLTVQRAKNWNKYGWNYWQSKKSKNIVDLKKLNALLSDK